ncbi:hypothetical protein [Piscinibacter terrae]|uniref:Uncharacterized protein n=1 Tax=Piscinibacter terrae TaxID=2496871 RepID=A0A3N7HNJ1_9BURK|nr:hypothetical protein [Albitalea terrae]RQP23680.1 hypothetical protein DZC73_16245 [Albitalea terrae]
MLDTLPASSFVPFAARRVAGARVLWHSGTLSPQALLERHAFAIGNDADATGDIGTFLAERYGGAGLVNNGGGVRCGLRDGYQVKGIGRNPLSGRDASFWYSHGAAALEEAVREAIWGEVCAAVLPHGGVRVHGVIATGREVPYDAGGGAMRTLPGALIVRDAVLRPGHYMRAVYYQPNEDVAREHPSDAMRTRLAILQLGTGLASALGWPVQSCADVAGINRALLEVAERLATQLAACRARKIVHGALTCSNVALDGRLLDYGTITAVSDYGRVIVARGFPDMLSDHAGFVTTLRNLAFYVHKYLPGASRQGLVQPEELVHRYLARLNDRACMEFLKLTGVTQQRLEQVPEATRLQVYACINDIVAAGNGEPFKLRDMPARMGRYHLNTILREAALSGEADMDARLAPSLPDAALRQRLVQSLLQLRQEAPLPQDETQRRHAQAFTALNACRLNSNMPRLYRAALMQHIEQCLAADDPVPVIDAAIRSLRDEAHALLADPVDGAFTLLARHGKPVQVHEQQGPLVDGSPMPWSNLFGEMEAPALSHEDAQRIPQP